jgi:hypothetical protein
MGQYMGETWSELTMLIIGFLLPFQIKYPPAAAARSACI